MRIEHIWYIILMTIFIGADHRGFELKNLIIDFLQEKNIRVEDLGSFEHNPEDDYVEYSKKVAQAVLQNPTDFLGIVLCGSGAGVDIAANRQHGIRCGLGFEANQVKLMKEDDDINMLALPADFVEFEKIKTLIDMFLSTKAKIEDKYRRRIQKLDS